jgi:mRNA interferase RelE/StbE
MNNESQVPFELRYHPAIVDEDIPRIPQNFHRRIAGTIESRLTHAPHQYGAFLRKTLKGYWKLRVGDYRVVSKIEENEVWVLGIRPRKTVYEDILQRLRAQGLGTFMPDLGRYLAHRSFTEPAVATVQSYRWRDIAKAPLKFRMSHFLLLILAQP